jgi:twinkle protein
MGRVAIRNQPCLNTDCGSSDARQVYENGTSFCFSCRSWFKPNKEEEQGEKLEEYTQATAESLAEIAQYETRGFKERKIEKNVTEFFGVKVGYDSKGNIDSHYYPYGIDSVTGYKVRKLPKQFHSTGKIEGLFGQSKFSSGKMLVITEGELDAMSVAQATYDKYKIIYPVVSLSSASGTKALLENREWVRKFDSVILLIDNDEAGNKCRDECIRIIGIDKVKVGRLSEKDASDVLVKKSNGGELIMSAIWNAETVTPAGIVNKKELWEALEQYNLLHSVPYPDCLEGINSKVKGMRLGEIALFISGTGSGKSTIFREIQLSLLESTQSKIGVISLEESPAETARKLSGMAINKNPAYEEIPLNQLKVGFDSVFDSDRVILLDHQGSIKDDSIIEQLEYMCLMGCQYLFIDHITILVSEGADGLTGNEAVDKVMNSLLRLCKKHNVYIGLISHLRKAQNGATSFEEGRLPSIDDIRGSGSIKQISFDIIAFARNMIATLEDVRNTIKMRVLKCRYTGLTGDVMGAVYEPSTGRLSAAEVLAL